MTACPKKQFWIFTTKHKNVLENRHYILTETAEQDFHQAKRWSLSRWGKTLTRQYFEDLHQGAEYIAANHKSLQKRDSLTGESGLGIHPVKEHYIIYVPTGDKEIVIVALIRQTRDVPNILKRNQFIIQRELKDIMKS